MFGSIGKALFGGSDSKSKSSSKAYVWGAQEGYLKDLYKNAQDLYKQGYANEGVAGFNNIQNQAMQGMLDYAGSTGTQLANTSASTANQLLGGYGAAQGYYSDLMNGGQQFNANANQFINSDLVNSQISAANQSVTDQFNSVMSDIALSSSMSGNTGSTRRAVAEVMAAKEAAKLKAGNVANIQGAAYNNAMNQMNTGAANMMNMANTGVNVMSDAYKMGMQPYQTALQVGGMQQNMQQSQMDWANNSNWDLLGRYQAAIGAPTVLNSSNSSSNSSSSPGIMGGVTGAISSLGFSGAGGFGLGSLGYGMNYGINPFGEQANMLANQW